MKIAKTTEYSATPEQVFEILASEEFQDAKCAATEPIEHSVTVGTSGERTIIQTERVMPSDGLPDFTKSFVGETLTVLETQDWGPAATDGSRDGTVKMAIKGAPLTLNGTISLKPGGAGTVEVLDTELKAKVPLIGGKIEKAAAGPIQEAIDIEVETVETFLRR